eukprot:SAG31_NODE_1673_length_7560_cov_3.528749_3_plen_93_part_00
MHDSGYLDCSHPKNGDVRFHLNEDGPLLDTYLKMLPDANRLMDRLQPVSRHLVAVGTGTRNERPVQTISTTILDGRCQRLKRISQAIAKLPQ